MRQKFQNSYNLLFELRDINQSYNIKATKWKIVYTPTCICINNRTKSMYNVWHIHAHLYMHLKNVFPCTHTFAYICTYIHTHTYKIYTHEREYIHLGL